MTKEQALASLLDAQHNTDREGAHGSADETLCEFLESLGHADLVAEWRKVKKWYA